MVVLQKQHRRPVVAPVLQAPSHAAALPVPSSSRSERYPSCPFGPSFVLAVFPAAN